jgi:hypothetical protein
MMFGCRATVRRIGCSGPSLSPVPAARDEETWPGSRRHDCLRFYFGWKPTISETRSLRGMTIVVNADTAPTV